MENFVFILLTGFSILRRVAGWFLLFFGWWKEDAWMAAVGAVLMICNQLIAIRYALEVDED